MSTGNGIHLDVETAEFIRGGVSIVVASRDAHNRPSLVRAFGCRLSDDRREVSILLSKSQGEALLRNWQTQPEIAVVFTQPSTHHSIQLKGRDARVSPACADDGELMRRYRESFADDLVAVGFAREFSNALLHCPEPEPCVVSFTPLSAYRQTPGPEAGAPMEMSK